MLTAGNLLGISGYLGGLGGICGILDCCGLCCRLFKLLRSTMLMP
jgi:hypothetical protein